MKKIDYSKLTAIDAMVGEDDEETDQLRALYENAKVFIESFKWYGKIRNVYFGLGVADVIGVFLFELAPVSEDVDRFLWVIIGDVPPAYIVIDNAPNPACALKIYVAEMNGWADAVNAGKSIDQNIPVSGAPTKKNAASLKKRLAFIEREILQYYKGDLT